MNAVERVRAAYARITAVERPEVWIELRREAEALAEAAAIDAARERGEALPLAGLTLAVKDNIDVAGMPTTAACPAFAYRAGEDAPAVARLTGAGAIVLGKTNMDQFATGLTGSRSPYGAVRDARRPDHVAGGSSSGSAVAVALGIADLALGTDTAGSGRVPAAFQGIVGIKPTRGLVPVRGVVPACRTLDCVTVFARALPDAELALAVMEGGDGADPLSRDWPPDARLVAPPQPRVGVPGTGSLGDLTPAAVAAFEVAIERLREAGAAIVPIDPAPLLSAGALLYGGAFVAERSAAVGAFIAAHRGEVEPTVEAIVLAAGEPSAARLAADRERLDRMALAVRGLFAELDALLMPTTTRQPTLAEVAAEPVAANARLGTYTNCVNLLDLCAVAVPAGSADGGSFGVSVLAPAFADLLAADVAALLTGGERGRPPNSGPAAVDLFVVGAHLSGQPLNHQLTELGARLAGPDSTAPSYRLFRLQTSPVKPGLVRVGSAGASIPGERWRLAPAALGAFLAAVPRPLTLGPVELADGGTVVGFLCEPAALEGARDITAVGGWRAHLALEG